MGDVHHQGRRWIFAIVWECYCASEVRMLHSDHIPPHKGTDDFESPNVKLSSLESCRFKSFTPILAVLARVFFHPSGLIPSLLGGHRSICALVTSALVGFARTSPRKLTQAPYIPT